MIYIFEVVLSKGKIKLPKIVIDMEGANSNDANNKILDKYEGEWKVYTSTMIGNRKSS